MEEHLSKNGKIRFRDLDFIGVSDYWVGTNGTIWSTKQKRPRKLFQGEFKKKPYKIVELWKNNIKKTFIVHRLVLRAFVGECPEGMQACHGDGNCQNNRLENLRWDTPEGNWKDRRNHGRINPRRGSKCGGAKLDDEKVQTIYRLYGTNNYSQRDLAKLFNISQMVIWSIVNRTSWIETPMIYNLKFPISDLLESYEKNSLKPLIREMLLPVKENLWENLIEAVEKSLRKELEKPVEDRPPANQVSMEVDLPQKGKCGIPVWEQKVFV